MIDFTQRDAFFGGGAQPSAGPQGLISPPNSTGGKGIIKFNPTSDEILNGIRPQVSLLVWQSPDGQPHYVTIDVGRLAGGVGGPGNDSLASGQAIGTGIGGGTFPLGILPNNNLLYYRACAQITLGAPGTMQDYFYVDINRGQRFTALASYVAITAQMDPPPTNGPLENPAVSGSMGVYATCGPAIAPTLAPVLFTQYVDDIPGPAPTPNGFVQIIPPRANTLLALVTNTVTSEALLLKFLNNAGEPTFRVSLTSRGIPQPIVIPQDIYSVAVTFDPVGLDLTGFYDWRLVYQLSV